MSNFNSPEYIRISTAAAITLGLKNGLFYRDARLYCINLLLTYNEGCMANCAYCGLAKKRMGDYQKKSFIRVDWPTYPTTLIIDKMLEKEKKIHRICISMITNKRATKDTLKIAINIRKKLNIPISILITPTIITIDWLKEAQKIGVDKIGIPIDLATKELFDKFRGRPHCWEKYWETFEYAIGIFGKRNVGAHFIVGLGETEKEMVNSIQKIYDMGGSTHLFSFFPEKNSILCDMAPPDIKKYRRIQLARYLIDNGIARIENMAFNSNDEIENFGLPKEKINSIIESGKPFMTSGCVGNNGEVACNRPYDNSPPGDEIRNYPFYPDKEDIIWIKKQLGELCDASKI